MTQKIPAAQDLDDAQLLDLVRAGDGEAFGILYERHVHAARRLARELVVSPAEIDDVVAETFDRVLDVTRRGGGPVDAFRPYVLTAVLRRCYDRLRSQRRHIPTAAPEGPETGEAFADWAGASPDRSLIVRAFLSLPQRWSAVLWHTEIERASLAEVAPLFGLTRSGAAALRQRAKDGLRQAYLDMHISEVTRQQCAPVAERLEAFVRDGLSGRASVMVSAHLTECADCKAAYAELTDINAALRGVVAPIFLGTAAASYLASAVHDTSAGAGSLTGTVITASADAESGVAVASASAGNGWITPPAGGGAPGAGTAVDARADAASTGPGTALVRASAGLPVAAPDPEWWAAASTDTAGRAGLLTRSRLRRASAPVQWLSAGAAVVVAVFAIAFAVTLTGNTTPLGPKHHHPQAVAVLSPASVATSSQAPLHTSTPAPRHSPSPSAKSAPSAATSPSASSNPHPAISPPPSSSAPPPSAQLAATVSVNSGGQFHSFGQVTFQVTDTGSAATGELAATITLPAGASMMSGGGGGGGFGGRSASDGGFGWSCQPTSTGATCQHAALAAGTQTVGAIFILLSGTTACGQPVQLAAASGSAAASAQSQGISC